MHFLFLCGRKIGFGYWTFRFREPDCSKLIHPLVFNFGFLCYLALVLHPPQTLFSSEEECLSLNLLDFLGQAFSSSSSLSLWTWLSFSSRAALLFFCAGVDRMCVWKGGKQWPLPNCRETMRSILNWRRKVSRETSGIRFRFQIEGWGDYQREMRESCGKWQERFCHNLSM